nr:putative integron gene cassette protein [uncultured bacterium]
MIYIIALILIGLSHLIDIKGMRGSSISSRLEKPVFVIGALAIMAATFQLCLRLVSSIDQRGSTPHDFTEHDMAGISGLVIYTLGLVVSVFLILIVLPKPIRR